MGQKHRREAAGGVGSVNHNPLMYVFTISNVTEGHWPTFRELVNVGIPRTVAKHYEIARWDMTEGLKERIEQAKN